MKRWPSMLILCSILGLAACAGESTSDGHDAGRDASDAPVDANAMPPDANTSATDAGRDASADVDATTPEDASVPVDAGPPPPATPSEAGQVVITEFQCKPAGYADDGLAEWVELYNPSDTTSYDLSGCYFEDTPNDGDYQFAATLVLGPHEYRVIASNTATLATHGFVSDATYGTTGTGLSSSGDNPTIRCGNTVIDTVSYSSGAGFVSCATNPGHTFQLDPSHLTSTDNDAGANWCVSAALFYDAVPGADGGENYGSPRAANVACGP